MYRQLAPSTVVLFWFFDIVLRFQVGERLSFMLSELDELVH